MMKTNYHLLALEEIDKLQSQEKRAKLLIHTCCAICGCHPLRELSEVFDITVMFNNSNIYPMSEYERRKQELLHYIDHHNQHDSHPIQIVITPYDNENYTKHLAPFANEPERGKRCDLCYRKRMQEGFKYASEHHFDYYTTVMSISRQKDSQHLNQIGKDLQNQFPNVKYFFSDFKKDNGILKANEIAKAFNMYRQSYCGCIYSYLKSKDQD